MSHRVHSLSGSSNTYTVVCEDCVYRDWLPTQKAAAKAVAVHRRATVDMRFLVSLPAGIDLDECPRWVREIVEDQSMSAAAAMNGADLITQWAGRPAKMTAVKCRA